MSNLSSRRNDLLPYIAVLVGAFLAYPTLCHDLWGDECYTLARFALDWHTALFDYRAPNNHQLFSFVLAWYLRLLPDDLVVDPVFLRALPFAFFLIALALTVRLAGRWGGRAGLFAALLFATGHPALNYATELRGYAFSWIPALLAAGCLSAYRATRKRASLAGYLGAMWWAVMILPTNLLISLALTVWCMAEDRLDGVPRAGLWRRYALLFFGPMAGLAILLPCADQLRDSIAAGMAMEKGHFLWHYPWAMLRDTWWLVLAGLIPCRRGRIMQAATGASLRPWLFAGILCVIPWLACLALPRTPTDRTLVTLYPLLMLGLGCGVAQAVECLSEQRRTQATAILAVLLVALAVWREHDGAGYVSRHGVAPEYDVHDIYDQQYNRQYRIEPIIDRIDAEAHARPVILLIGQGDVIGALFHCRLRYGEDVSRVLPITCVDLSDTPDASTNLLRRESARAVYVLASTQTHARAVASQAGYAGSPLHCVMDEGFFKLYVVTASHHDE